MSMAFIDPPEWIPLMPRPGAFKHPSYGEIAITPERNANFVRNFKAGIYQRRVPVDAEHHTKLSGALGWIVDMRQNGDGSADGRVEWNDRGRTMLGDNRYGYISPEFYDSWTAPESGEKHSDILIGAALTTRPFFKEGALRPLIASEGRLFEPPDDIESDPPEAGKGEPVMADQQQPATPPANPAPQPANPPGGNPPTPPAEPAAPRSMAELSAELEASRKFAEEQAAANKQMAERIAAMETSDRRKRFTDEVMGRSEASNIRWFGEVEPHVKILESLAATFGEEAPEFAGYVTQQRAVAEQVRTSALMVESGRPHAVAASGSALAKAEAKAAEFRQASPALTKEQALEKAFGEDPALYEAYDREARR